MDLSNWYWSASRLKCWNECAVKGYRRYVARNLPDEPTEAMQAGTLVHRIVQGHSDPLAGLDLLRVKAGGPNAAARRALEQAAALLADETCARYLSGVSEWEVTWTNDQCQSRPWNGYYDGLCPVGDCGGYVVEIKTCRDVLGTEWVQQDGRNVRVPWWEAFGYDRQAAAYCEASGMDVYVLAVDGNLNTRVWRMRHGGYRQPFLWDNMVREAEAWEDQVLRQDYPSEYVAGCGACPLCADWTRTEVQEME